MCKGSHPQNQFSSEPAIYNNVEQWVAYSNNVK